MYWAQVYVCYGNCGAVRWYVCLSVLLLLQSDDNNQSPDELPESQQQELALVCEEIVDDCDL